MKAADATDELPLSRFHPRVITFGRDIEEGLLNHYKMINSPVIAEGIS